MILGSLIAAILPSDSQLGRKVLDEAVNCIYRSSRRRMDDHSSPSLVTLLGVRNTSIPE